MPPKAATELPAPSKCSAPDCDYTTPTGLPNHDLVTQHLQIHAQVVHAAAQRPGTRATSSAAKVDKRPRPEAAQEMTEHAFRFFESEWGLYKRATGIAGQTLIDELWSCMSPELKKLAFDLGDIETLVTEDLMMKRIKGLAVAVLHAAVHTVHLHEAKQLSDESIKKQLSDESIKTFAARVKGIASNCQLQKLCSCGKDVSYLEETVYHVVLSGIRDGELQEACTTQALLKNITDINSLVEFCTAKESGHLAANSTVGHIRSAYHAGKFQTQKPPQTPPPTNCGYCGARRHGDGSKKAREKDCHVQSVADLPTSPRCAGPGLRWLRCWRTTRMPLTELSSTGSMGLSRCLSTTPSTSPPVPRPPPTGSPSWPHSLSYQRLHQHLALPSPTPRPRPNQPTSVLPHPGVPGGQGGERGRDLPGRSSPTPFPQTYPG